MMKISYMKTKFSEPFSECKEGYINQGVRYSTVFKNQNNDIKKKS